jgi:hypothetical protein
MRTWMALPMILALLAFGGCRKTARQFYGLESRATILVDRDGEAGLMSDEMGTIIAALRAIPPDAEEGPKASALLAHLEAERSSVVQRRADAARAAEVEGGTATAVPSASAPPPLLVAGPDAGSGSGPDAGLDRPWANMSLAEFQERFGACMESAGERDGSKGERLAAWEVLRTPTCIVKYGLEDEARRFFLFRSSKLAEEQTVRRVVTVIDAGRPPPAAPIPANPYVMGMPMPGVEAPDAQ